MDISFIIRKVADAYEERNIRMFEGYARSIKDDFDFVIAKVKYDIEGQIKSSWRNINEGPRTNQEIMIRQCEI